jgi:hypothetical protein
MVERYIFIVERLGTNTIKTNTAAGGWFKIETS